MGSTAFNLCDFLPENFDEEDFYYIQKSFCALFPSAKMCEFMDKSGSKGGCHYRIDSSVLNSFDFSKHSKRDHDESLWNINKNCTYAPNHKSSTSKISKSQRILDPNPFDSKKVFGDIVKNGIDGEDLGYLKRSFNILLWDPSQRYWTSKVCWDDHPPTADQIIKVENKDDLPVNKTGCARTEGYHKIDKVALLKRRNIQKMSNGTVTSNNIPETPYSKNYKGNKQRVSRDARNDQRRLSTAYETITRSDLLKLNELKFRKKKLRLGKSQIHGLGIFAEEPIAPKEIIIEYVGQIIRPIVADLREKVYKASGIGSYCFRVDEDTILDATKLGNLNRFINHSCSPNSYAKVLVINNQKKIVIYSRKAIKVGEEITYNYKMPYEDEKVPCLCGARGCRKYLN